MLEKNNSRKGAESQRKRKGKTIRQNNCRQNDLEIILSFTPLDRIQFNGQVCELQLSSGVNHFVSLALAHPS
jgi:hypothetical protein